MSTMTAEPLTALTTETEAKREKGKFPTNMSQLLVIANTGRGGGAEDHVEALQTRTPTEQRWSRGVCQPLGHVKNPPLTAATQLMNRRASEGVFTHAQAGRRHQMPVKQNVAVK